MNVVLLVCVRVSSPAVNPPVTELKTYLHEVCGGHIYNNLGFRKVRLIDSLKDAGPRLP
jgi:hypothetical protein